MRPGRFRCFNRSTAVDTRVSGAAFWSGEGIRGSDVNVVLRLDRQAQLGTDLFLREEVVTGVDCGAFVVGGPV